MTLKIDMQIRNKIDINMCLIDKYYEFRNILNYPIQFCTIIIAFVDESVEIVIPWLFIKGSNP